MTCPSTSTSSPASRRPGNEEDKAEEAKKPALKEFEDLLDFPVFTATSVAAVDETAAQVVNR
jgi:hypothetical protein